MENFTVTTRLSTNEYVNLMYAGLYRKPVYIFATLLGLYFWITVVLNRYYIIHFYQRVPVFEIICGFILLLAPTIIVLISVSQFVRSPDFQNDVTYSFNRNGFEVHGAHFKNEHKWIDIIKYKEYKNFIVLYNQRKFGYIIHKSNLTTDELDFIKSAITV